MPISMKDLLMRNLFSPTRGSNTEGLAKELRSTKVVLSLQDAARAKRERKQLHRIFCCDKGGWYNQ